MGLRNNPNKSDPDKGEIVFVTISFEVHTSPYFTAYLWDKYNYL